MKTFSRTLWIGIFVILLTFVRAAFLSAQPAAFQPPVMLTNGTIRFTVTGPASKAHRIEVSVDLTHWTPLLFLGNTNASKSFIAQAGTVPEFYRAIEQTSGFQVMSIEPSAAFPGTEMVIRGIFTVPPTDTDKLVRFGSAVAEVVQATDFEWRVIVPPFAESGPIRLLTGTTNAESEQAFTLLAGAAVTIIPPTGMQSDTWTAVNPFGGTVMSNSTPTLQVRGDFPTLNAAANSQTNRFLYAFSMGGGPITLSMETTAEAFVFMSPMFATGDPLLATRTLQMIQTNAEVHQLALLLDPLYSQPDDPFTNSSIIIAYSNAVVAVAGTSEMLSLSGRYPKKSRTTALFGTVPSGDYLLDMEYTMALQTTKKNAPLGPYAREMHPWTGPRFPYLNPVDWNVMIQEIDVDAAFPQGKIDFDKVYHEKRRLEVFPLKEFSANSSVSASIVTEHFNLVKAGMKKFADEVINAIKPSDDSIQFPQRDGVYVLRSIGPGVSDTPEITFTRDHYREERIRAIASNMAAVVLDMVSLLIDLETLKIEAAHHEIAAKATLEIFKAAPGLREPADFGKLTVDIVKFVLQEIADKLANAGAKAVFGQAVKGAAEKTSLLNTTLSALDKFGGAGQIFQRETGLFTTTPMETTLIVIGEPFKLTTVTITPTNAAPGDEVQIHFQSTAVSRMFNAALSTDAVNFEGPSYFDGEILEVTGTTNNQTLRVKIPLNLTTSADGNYTVFVNIQGRRGQVDFKLTSIPYISSITPLAGFAAVDDFDGLPFNGSQLRVKGALFTSSSRFFFGDTNAPEVTSKSGGTGNVQISIPKNANSSFVRVVYRNAAGQDIPVDGPVVTVWKNPIIDSVTPTHGSIGAPVTLKLRNAGTDANLIRAQFTGSIPVNVAVYPDGTIKTAVSAGATNGTLTVITPGGSSSVPFTVDPGTPGVINSGSPISVGGSSVITLARGIAFAEGTGYPTNNTEDPPYDEGDYVTAVSISNEPPDIYIGPAYRNSVNLNSTTQGGNYTFTGTDIYSSGTLTGNITVSAERCSFNNIVFLGPVSITGNSNSFLSCSFSNTVTVTGTGNTIGNSGSVISGQLIIEGDNNTTASLTQFRFTPSHALIVRGHHNRIVACNFYTNSGDAVRVEGGQYNFIELNNSRSNSGNGITLTGGAAYNEVKFNSGISSGGIVTTGNKGHGVAMLGDAHDNWVYTLANGISGNDLDGVHLDGTNVVRNRLGGGSSFVANLNGRNGVTLTNGVSNTTIGLVNLDGSSTSVNIFSNKLNGLCIAGAKFTAAAVTVRSNGANGVLISGVTDPPSGTGLSIITGSSTAPGNGNAGLRLENGTTGVRAQFLSSNLRHDNIGVELDGTNVQNNYLEGNIQGCKTDGVVIRGARRNELKLSIQNCTNSGVVFYGGQKNLLRINNIQDCTLNGIHFYGGSENTIISSLGSPFLGTITRTRNGIVMEQGATGNSVLEFNISHSRECGVLIDGPATAKNSFIKANLLNSGLDGLRVQNGASGVTFGVGVDNPFAAIRNISMHDNTNAAVRITGNGTHDVTIAGCFISKLSGANFPPAGIVVENNATDVLLTHNTVYRNVDGIIVKDGARRVTIQKSIADSNQQNGILISNGSDVLIGGANPDFANSLYANPTAIKLTGNTVKNCQIENNFIYDNTEGIILEQRANVNRVGPGNIMDRNPTAILVDWASTNTFFENTIRNSAGAAIEFDNGATDNLVTANLIRENNVGVWISGPNSLRNSILDNSITANGGNGIRLVSGGNKQIAAPDFEEVQADAITGTSTAPDGSRVQIFKDAGIEGETLFTTAQVVNGRFRAPIDEEPWKVGLLFNVTATVTDPEGNTSEFKSKFPEDDAGEKFVFTSTRDGNSEIYLIAPPSPAPINLTQNGGNDSSPALAGGSTNCNELLFVSDRTGNLDIFAMTAVAGGPLRQLTTSLSNDYDPDWLQPCGVVVFVSERDGNPEIYKMNADGTGVTRLTTHSAIDRHPTASPDGTKIYFQSNRGGQFALWVMNADGSNQQQFLSGTTVDTQPAISPDGLYVAFVSQRDGNAEIYTVQTNGTNLQRITSHTSSDLDPSWTADGSQILFTSHRSGAAELFLVPRSGGLAQPVTISSGENNQPSVARQ